MKKILWIGFGLAVGVATLPLVIGAVGLAIGSQELATYHWFTYFSIPLGLVLLCCTVVAAFIFPVLKKRSNSN